MKKFFSLLLIIAFASHFGTNEVFAQKPAKSSKLIIVKIILANGYELGSTELEIPSKSKQKTGSAFGGGCGDCEKLENYSAFFTARYITKSKSKISVSLEIDDCKTK